MPWSEKPDLDNCVISEPNYGGGGGKKLRQPENIRSVTFKRNGSSRLPLSCPQRFEALGNGTTAGGKGMTEGWYKTAANFLDYTSPTVVY